MTSPSADATPTPDACSNVPYGSSLPSPPPVEYAAIILASTYGERLFPLTDDADATNADDDDVRQRRRRLPKHLLPLANGTVLDRLLLSLSFAGYGYIILLEISETAVDAPSQRTVAPDAPASCPMVVRTVPLSPDVTSGSADALRLLISGGHLHPKSHAMVLTGDLVVMCPGTLRAAAEAHREARMQYPCRGDVACTMLLSDVGREDEDGAPLKESAKQKKGWLSREDEEIDYTGLSSLPPSSSVATYPHSPLPHRRVLLKRPLLEVEEDIHFDGTLPKLSIPFVSALLPSSAGGGLSIRTDLHDVHVYVLSNWALGALNSYRWRHMTSLQGEYVPMLVRRQGRGVAAVVPDPKSNGDGGESMSGGGRSVDSSRVGSRDGKEEEDETAFVVSAVVVPRGLRLLMRACTVPAYLFACREVVSMNCFSTYLFSWEM
uniref:Translation initiation factor eIF2B subunit gamma n=1 Tax=Corethron hystrix TaxID=216773 RepID=A0A7S1BQS5_9STRA